MKYNIRRVTLQDKPDPNGKWWKWNETCDRCGAICRDDHITTSSAPDTNEKDYCIDCLRQLLAERRMSNAT